jgi:hypothetical protein
MRFRPGIGAGGGGGIRTHERRKPLPVFKTGAFNRSATPPILIDQALFANSTFWTGFSLPPFAI